MNEKLKWNNHVSSLLQNVKIKAPYTDAYLACNGKLYEVHRMILSSCSTFFAELFKQTSTETPFIILANMKSRCVESLLNYMYNGEVNVAENEIDEIMDAANYFKIKGLFQAIRTRQPKIGSNYASASNDTIITDLSFSPPRKKKKQENDIQSGYNKFPNVLESAQNALNYLTYDHTSMQIQPVVKESASRENYEVLDSMGLFPKQSATAEPNNSTQIWKKTQESYEDLGLISNLANTLANNTKQNQAFQVEKSATEARSEFIHSEDNYSNDDSLSDFSEIYSSDDDPIMASRIRKIVRKTYKNLITKMKGRNHSFKASTSLPLHSRSLITISTVNKADGRKVNGRINYCYFCNSPQTQIWRHIKNVHKDEPQVARISGVRGNNEQKWEIDFLRNLGNYYHNKEVLSAGNGELKVYRRPDCNTQLSFRDFTPCPKCLLFLSRTDLWRHYKYKCMPQSLASSKKGAIGNFSHLLFMSLAVLGIQPSVQKAEKKIVSRLKSDEITNIATKDEIIMHLGSFMFDNVRADRFDIVEQIVRLSARILFYVRRRLNQHHLTMFQILRPSYFGYVSEAIDVLSRYLSTEEPQSPLTALSSPEIALQLTNLIRKCLAVKLGNSLRIHSEQDKVDTNELVASLDKLCSDFASFIPEEKNLISPLEMELEDRIEDEGNDFMNEEVIWEGNRVFGEDSHDTESIMSEDVSGTPNARSVAALKRVPYSPSENDAIFKYFGDLIERGQMIKKEDIDRLFRNPTYGGELNNRSWKNIKYKVHNIIQKKNKHRLAQFVQAKDEGPCN